MEAWSCVPLQKCQAGVWDGSSLLGSFITGVEELNGGRTRPRSREVKWPEWKLHCCCGPDILRSSTLLCTWARS